MVGAKKTEWLAAVNIDRAQREEWVELLLETRWSKGRVYLETYALGSSFICSITHFPLAPREVRRDQTDENMFGCGSFHEIKNCPRDKKLIDHIKQIKPNLEFSICKLNQNNSISIAVDHYSGMCAFYAHIQRGSVAGSDIALILAHPEIHLSINEKLCGSFFEQGHAVGEDELGGGATFFSDIFQVPSASVLELVMGDVVIDSWWHPPREDELKGLGNDHASQFRELMALSVSERCFEENIMIEVSGGIDSASVLAAACLASKRERIKASSMIFEDSELAESHDRKMVEKICSHLGVPVTFVNGDQTLKIPHLFSNDFLHLNGPDPRANPLACNELDRVAFKQDTSVVLCGEGGDGLIDGNSFALGELVRANEWSKAWDWSKRATRSKGAIKYLINNGILPNLPFVPQSKYQDLAWGDSRAPLPEYFHIKGEARRAHKKTVYKNWSRRYIFDFLWPRARYINTLTLNIKRCSLFLDRRIIEFGLSVDPLGQLDLDNIGKNSYAWHKKIQREAFADLLPKEIVHRKNKTTYAMMARKRLTNASAKLLDRFSNANQVYLHQMGIIDADLFFKRLVAELILAEDRQCDLSMHYHYIHHIIGMELWLSEMKKSKNEILNKSGLTTKGLWSV